MTVTSNNLITQVVVMIFELEIRLKIHILFMH